MHAFPSTLSSPGEQLGRGAEGCLPTIPGAQRGFANDESRRVMNLPLQLKCPTCGAPSTQRVHLNDPTLDFTCEKCCNTWYGVSGLDVTVGVLLLARSWNELEAEKDYDMSIVLAAAAFDCELSWLFCKWKKIEALGSGRAFAPGDCDKELRRVGNVAEKITKVSMTLCGSSIERFVDESSQWKKTLKKIPSLHAQPLAEAFQRAVFWPRNEVLHQGQATHTQKDACRCYSIADLGIRILKAMDKARAARL